MKYEEIPDISQSEVEAAIAENDVERLSVVVLSAALNSDDPAWAEGICQRLAHHSNAVVRGNAILGLGHLARLHGHLDLGATRPIIAAALQDEEAYVRGQAEAAAGDIEFFLGQEVRPKKAV